MTEMVLPQFGMGMSDGTIIAWHKAIGDVVTQGEPLCDVEAAKTTVEVVAPCDGILQKIVVPAGSNALVNSVIAVIGNDAVVAAPQEPVSPPVATKTPPVATLPQTAPQRPGKGPQIEPRARRAARLYNIDLDTLSGTGPGGRIIEEDVIRSAQAGPAAALSPATRLAPPMACYQLRMRCNGAPLMAILEQLAPHCGGQIPIAAALLRALALSGKNTFLAGQSIGFRSDDGTIISLTDPLGTSLQAITANLASPDNTPTPAPALVIEWHAETWLDEVVRIDATGPAGLSVNAIADNDEWQIVFTTGNGGPDLAEGKALLERLKNLLGNPLILFA